jgi:hypothetical protein
LPSKHPGNDIQIFLSSSIGKRVLAYPGYFHGKSSDRGLVPTRSDLLETATPLPSSSPTGLSRSYARSGSERSLKGKIPIKKAGRFLILPIFSAT